jgi:hypothetical protein
MCPVCLSTAALTVAATASGGALTVFVAKTLGVTLPRKAVQPLKTEERSR